MMFSIFYLLIFLPFAYCSPYVPGTPGAPWTSEELFAIKGQLTWIIRNSRDALFKVQGGPVAFLEGKIANWETVTGKFIYKRYSREAEVTLSGIKENSKLEDTLLPNIGKMVRLAFHDCLKDTETGGCNGCLNFRNMGSEGEGADSQGCHRDKSCPKDSLERRIDNNNLLWVARVLEILYTDPEPPFSKSRRFKLKKSLKDAGKSRADLWAYAGLVAMEISTYLHNNYCDPEGEGLCPGQFDERSPSCYYDLPTLTFKTGRRDCTPSCTGTNSFYDFCSVADEVQPDALGNGDSVIKFFKDTFNFTARESVAILGAHSLGHAHEQISGFRHYPWTGGFTNVLNNNYYKQMVDPGMYRVRKQRGLARKQKCNLKISTFIGDEYGNAITSFWLPRSQWQNNDGGPWNWNPFGLKCDPRKCEKIPDSQKSKASCCRHFGPEGLDCMNTGFKNRKCKHLCDPKNDRRNCSMPTFMQTSYLNSDMGLFLKFDTDAKSGRPKECSGLNDQNWLTNKRRQPRKPHGCPLNDAMDNSGLKMHEIVKKFADDEQAWINEFVPTFQKMQENGYLSGSLSTSPNTWQGLICNNNNCKRM